MRHSGLIALVLLAALIVPGATASSAGPVSSRYLQMRNGVRLAVDVRLPDATASGARVPTIFGATRYGRRSHLEETAPFVEHGYAVVVADARGTGASFGKWAIFSPDELADYGQVVDWIVTQPWSNGHVGTWGISYGGGTAELAATTRRTGIRAVAPTYFTDDPYADIVYPGGIFNRRFVSWWSAFSAQLDRGGGATPVDGDIGEALTSQALAEHSGNMNVLAAAAKAPYRDDSLGPFAYAAMSPASHRDVLSAVGMPYLVVTGWLDGADVRGALRRYVSLPNPQLLVIGPWNHGGSEDANPFRAAASQPDPSGGMDLLTSFFDITLGDAPVPATREIRYFTLGENRWHETSVWPPPGLETRRLYLAHGAQLRPTAPDRNGGSDRYQVRFDATTGFHNRWFLDGGDVVYPDRRSENRKLLTFTTAALAHPTEVTGTVVVSLRLASTAKDGALFAYLEDVAPNGRVTYVTEGELRISSRRLAAISSPLEAGGPLHSYVRADARPLRPGRVEQLRIGMIPTSVVFEKGHRIRLAVAGADRDTFARLPAHGGARLTVFHHAGRLSWIELPTRTTELPPSRP